MDVPQILVADDSPTLRRIVSQVMTEAEYGVETASDGVETVQRFYSIRPDLLICDINMPKLSGYLVCRLIKEDWSASHVPVLMLTSRDTPSDRFWAAKSGAERFLTKDFGPDDLLDALSELLANRRPSFLAPVSAPQHLSESGVLTRVCEMLDRKLYESTLVNEIGELGSHLADFSECADRSLEVMSHVLGFTVGAIALTEERVFAVRPSADVSEGNIADMVRQLSEALTHTPGVRDSEFEPTVVTFEGRGRVVEHETPSLQTFVSMPLRSGGNVTALLGLASSSANAFGESELATLRVIEHPLAAVIDNARLYERVARSGSYGVR